MKDYLVKDLMVPISEYTTVVLGTSLLEAVQALERAQKADASGKYQHQAILVLDTNKHVVGKISQLRALKAVEPKHDFDDEIKEIEKFNFSNRYITQIRDRYRSHRPIMAKQSLQRASIKKVEDFMQTPLIGEFVSETSSLDTAIHRFVAETHFSLLVTRAKEIVGVLRISDVFAAVFREMKLLEDID